MSSPYAFIDPTPSASRAGSVSHGGAEQEPRDVFGRTFSGTAVPPNPFGLRRGFRVARTAPNTPRVRSPDNTERSRDRRSPPEPQGEAIGVTFRLNAIEQTLRQHTAELVTQKTYLDAIQAEKTTLETRLDQTFRDWNARLTDMEQKSKSAWDQTQSLLQAMNSRMDKIEADLSSLLTRHVDTRPMTPPGFAPNPEQQTTGPTGFPASSAQGTSRPETFNMASPPRQGANAPGVADSWSPLGGHHQGSSNGGHSQRASGFGAPEAPQFNGFGAPPMHSQGGFGAPPMYPHGPHSEPAPFGPPPGTGNHGWAAAGFGTNTAPWREQDWTVDTKTSKELKMFDGDIKSYDKWRLRIRYHFINTNMYYKDIFDLIEKEKNIINWRTMSNCRVPDLPNVHWAWVATHLWSFVSRFLGDTMLGRMDTLANNEEFNGIELWRNLYLEFMGGSTEMSHNERNFFVNFPKCTKDEDLQTHLSTWSKLRLAYGGGIPDEHMKIMFRNTLPDHVLEELKKQHLDVTQKEYNWVMGELGRFNDSRLSKWNMTKLVQQLKPKGSSSINQIGAVEPSTSEPPPPPPVPDWSSIEANMARMIAAAFEKNDRGRSGSRTPQGSRSGSRDSRGGQRSRGGIPNPKFDGCWCCGKKGHSRQKCKKFLAIKEKNGGKVPADYEGAYEKAMKKAAAAAKPVAAIGVQSGVREHDETMIWPLLSAKGPIFRPTPIKNSFSSLSYDNENDDEAEVVKALSQLTSSVRRASDKPQTHKRPNQGLNMARIHSLAKQLRDGELNLPDLELDSNDEYECVWALVDTGAGVNCGSKAHFPDAIPVEAPEVLLTTASGDPLPNKGAMKVVTKSKEGVTRERIFYDAPVDIPILSVAEVSQEGLEGSDTLFRRIDGYIEDSQTHERQHFVKRKGVYFMKLYIERHKNNKGFGRPGNQP